ncbi:NACHT domain-containing protein [Novosphingobium sp. G106]|uniref:NACHT domain-containing protein n=1 Tax=Novosphingobium sp. G106 TaxID=2849500 RepID=UPI001C2DEADD|nr:NACHT domain-containing protein [Novosphingobium sp. G106]MBV1691752.1 NACHT domain-containing protein [Novosphingobium sp. G106]
MDEPTADQNDVVRSYKVNCPKEIISFSTLFSRLFDGRHYIRLRGDHFFGSIRNPADDNDYNVPPSSYIQTALNNVLTGENKTALKLSEQTIGGQRFIIYGDYGSGKSMTLRDIYSRCRDRFSENKTIQCPIYLNLRKHIAQLNPDEALFRHAQLIGFEDPNRLISAWRAGFVTLFLDGFDELTPPQFGVSISNLKHARRLAVELVKKFFEQTPGNASIFLAGRENYFDSRDESRQAIGYSTKDTVLELAGFNDEQIAKYLKLKSNMLPNWLPTRPLLLGYLANSGLLKDSEELAALNPTSGWDHLLNSICEREVKQIWGAGAEALELRLFIEGLSTKARQSAEGSKGLQESDIKAVFRAVFGRDADEPANLLAGRLPGLGAVPGRVGAREFIDIDFADAAGSGDLKRFIESPFVEHAGLEDIKRSLQPLGLSLTSEKIADAESKLSIALSQASKNPKLSITASDIIAIITEKGSAYKGDPIIISDANFDSITVDANINFSSLTFKSCVFSRVEMGRDSSKLEEENYPTFLDCVIDTLEGVVSRQDLPSDVLRGDTTVERYAAFAGTNNAILESTLPPAVKVLLTVLRKLFLQRGSGRQYSALNRGLPASASKYVEDIVSLIKSHNFAEEIHLDRRKIIIPNRGRSSTALSIINGPNTSTDALLIAARSL